MHPVHVEDPQKGLVDAVVQFGGLEPGLDLVDEADGLGEVDGLLVAVDVLQLDGESLGQEGVESEDVLQLDGESLGHFLSRLQLACTSKMEDAKCQIKQSGSSFQKVIQLSV